MHVAAFLGRFESRVKDLSARDHARQEEVQRIRQQLLDTPSSVSPPANDTTECTDPACSQRQASLTSTVGDLRRQLATARDAAVRDSRSQYEAGRAEATRAWQLRSDELLAALQGERDADIERARAALVIQYEGALRSMEVSTTQLLQATIVYWEDHVSGVEERLGNLEASWATQAAAFKQCRQSLATAKAEAAELEQEVDELDQEREGEWHEGCVARCSRVWAGLLTSVALYLPVFPRPATTVGDEAARTQRPDHCPHGSQGCS